MAGETVITIIGNLTDEPELRTTRNGEAVCNVNIASNTRQYNSQSGQWEDGDTLYMRGTIWRDMAQHCAQSLHKGMRVIAQGRLQQRSYQAQDGTNRTVVEMQVDEIGPSLRNATAQVQKIQRGGYQGASQNGFNNPPASGFQQPQQAGQQPAQSQQLGGDPWASNNNQPSDFGSFGGNTDEF